MATRAARAGLLTVACVYPAVPTEEEPKETSNAEPSPNEDKRKKTSEE